MATNIQSGTENTSPPTLKSTEQAHSVGESEMKGHATKRFRDFENQMGAVVAAKFKGQEQADKATLNDYVQTQLKWQYYYASQVMFREKSSRYGLSSRPDYDLDEWYGLQWAFSSNKDSLEGRANYFIYEEVEDTSKKNGKPGKVYRFKKDLSSKVARALRNASEAQCGQLYRSALESSGHEKLLTINFSPTRYKQAIAMVTMAAASGSRPPKLYNQNRGAYFIGCESNKYQYNILSSQQKLGGGWFDGQAIHIQNQIIAEKIHNYHRINHAAYKLRRENGVNKMRGILRLYREALKDYPEPVSFEQVKNKMIENADEKYDLNDYNLDGLKELYYEGNHVSADLLDKFFLKANISQLPRYLVEHDKDTPLFVYDSDTPILDMATLNGMHGKESDCDQKIYYELETNKETLKNERRTLEQNFEAKKSDMVKRLEEIKGNYEKEKTTLNQNKTDIANNLKSVDKNIETINKEIETATQQIQRCNLEENELNNNIKEEGDQEQKKKLESQLQVVKSAWSDLSKNINEKYKKLGTYEANKENFEKQNEANNTNIETKKGEIEKIKNSIKEVKKLKISDESKEIKLEMPEGEGKEEPQNLENMKSRQEEYKSINDCVKKIEEAQKKVSGGVETGFWGLKTVRKHSALKTAEAYRDYDKFEAFMEERKKTYETANLLKMIDGLEVDALKEYVKITKVDGQKPVDITEDRAKDLRSQFKKQVIEKQSETPKEGEEEIANISCDLRSDLDGIYEIKWEGDSYEKLKNKLEETTKKVQEIASEFKAAEKTEIKQAKKSEDSNTALRIDGSNNGGQ